MSGLSRSRERRAVDGSRPRAAGADPSRAGPPPGGVCVAAPQPRHCAGRRAAGGAPAGGGSRRPPAGSAGAVCSPRSRRGAVRAAQACWPREGFARPRVSPRSPPPPPASGRPGPHRRAHARGGGRGPAVRVTALRAELRRSAASASAWPKAPNPSLAPGAGRWLSAPLRAGFPLCLAAAPRVGAPPPARHPGASRAQLRPQRVFPSSHSCCGLGQPRLCEDYKTCWSFVSNVS